MRLQEAKFKTSRTRTINNHKNHKKCCSASTLLQKMWILINLDFSLLGRRYITISLFWVTDDSWPKKVKISSSQTSLFTGFQYLSSEPSSALILFNKNVMFKYWTFVKIFHSNISDTTLNVWYLPKTHIFEINIKLNSWYSSSSNQIDCQCMFISIMSDSERHLQSLHFTEKYQ